MRSGVSRQRTPGRAGKVLTPTLVLAAALAAGCVASGPRKIDLPRDEQPLPVLDIRQITPASVTTHAPAQPSPAPNPGLERALAEYEYRVGPRDVLSFTVWDHPELTIPAGEFRAADHQGHLVAADGTIFFPYVGSVRVADKTLQEIRADLTERLSRFVREPQLDVRIAAYRSRKVLVLGEVVQPGPLPLTDTPMTLIEALSLAGGATPEGATRRITVLRDGTARRYDFLRMMEHGDLTQNLLLRDGDIVFVPLGTSDVVHVFGAVRDPGPVAAAAVGLSLANVLGDAGGIDPVAAHAGRVIVFRDERPAVLYWLDLRSPAAWLLAARFTMQRNDVVYVETTRLADWNRTVSLILPTVQTLWQTQSLIDEVRD